MLLKNIELKIYSILDKNNNEDALDKGFEEKLNGIWPIKFDLEDKFQHLSDQNFIL